jgi:hypothetical protein
MVLRRILWGLFIGLLAASLSAAAMAEPVYRWKDARGLWHFSDVPPRNGEAQEAKLQPLSVVSMPRAASAGEASVPPECAPGYRGDQVCEPGQQSPLPASEPGAAAPDDGAAASEKRGAVREDTLESRSEKLIDFNEKKRDAEFARQKRIEEIEEEREIKKVRRLTPGDRNDDPTDRIPKTVNQKLQDKNVGKSEN